MQHWQLTPAVASLITWWYRILLELLENPLGPSRTGRHMLKVGTRCYRELANTRRSRTLAIEGYTLGS